MTAMLTKEAITTWFEGLQQRICTALAAADGGARFREDVWDRPGGGGGKARVLTNGQVIEKGGVNFSAVYGETPPAILRALELAQADFYATGVSIIMHPHSPMVPIIHMNVRYFEMSNGTAWLGGGIDLTPHYIDEEDARFFHRSLKQVCEQHHPHYYPKFKDWADDYFYVKHRKETRGIGGIFFDRLSPTDGTDLLQLFSFVQDVGEAFVPIYTHLMDKNRSKPYGEAEKEWQLIRRGRYVEFNLVHDKGTKFGLDTEGRIESILMSLPPLAAWQYAHVPAADSPEARTLSLLKKGVSWV